MWRTSLISSCIIPQQCPECLVCLTWKVSGVGGKWSYNCCFVEFASRICSKHHAESLSSSYLAFSSGVLQVVQPYDSTDAARAWKNSRFISSENSEFYMVDNQSIAMRVLYMRMLTMLSVDEDIATEVYEMFY